MDQIPTKNNVKLNFIEIQPDENEGIAAKPMNKIVKLKTGTTTVGIKIKDGVVLATDNRATMGLFIASKTAKKVHKIQDYMYLTIAGGVADAQYLVDLLRAETNLYNLQNDKKITVAQTAKLLQNILYGNKGYFEVGHILGGYIPSEGPKIYDIEGYGSVLEEDYVSIGSGSLFAIGVLETEWKPDLSLDEGMDLCIKSVRSAIIRDIGSGNGIDVVALYKNKVVTKSYKVSDKDIINNTFYKKK
jgi:proteasome beta subunit